MVGTVHGFYATKPRLDFQRIRKINYFSYMSNAGVKAVKELLEEKDVLQAMAMFALD